MENFTETQIQQMMKALKWDFGVENHTRELAILELEDLKRKGCTLEHIGECRGCSAGTKENSYCPLADWEKRHPEYANDELAMKIKVLEAGGEEAYKEKQKRQEEAKKKAEEEKNKASDEDRVNAARKVCAYLQNAKEPTSAHLFNFIAQNILNAKTKIEIDNAVSMICLDKS